MHIKRQFHYDAPVDRVTDLMVEAYLDDPSMMLNSPNVTDVELTEKREEGDRVFATVRYCAHSRIPRVVRHLITPDMLTWLSFAEWDRRNRVYSFDTKTKYFTKKVKCRGDNYFTGNGSGKTLHTLDMRIEIKIPVFGLIVEKEAARILMHNIEENVRFAKQLLAEDKSKSRR